VDELIITAALTGSRVSKRDTPFIPITPDEIAQAGIEAWRAGAAILHVHVRDPQTGLGTQDVSLFKQVVERLRAETDAILCLTTSGIPGLNLPTEGRLAPLALRPELASFDAGSINMGAGIFLNPPEFLDALAARAREMGVKLELECFEAGMVSTCLRYLGRGLLTPPLHFQFVLGTPYGMPATAKSLLHLAESIPDHATWSVAGTGKAQLPMAMLGMVMGGHVRVGLEDNIFYGKGVPAESNAALVARVVRLAAELGRDVASSTRAREILHLQS